MITPKEFLDKQHREHPGDYGICPPPTPAQEAVNTLIEHFLGKGWYSTMPMGAEQVNTQAVCEILDEYPGYLEKDERKARLLNIIRSPKKA